MKQNKKRLRTRIAHRVPFVKQARQKLRRRNMSFTQKIRFRMRHELDDPKWAPYVDKLLFKEYAKSKGLDSPQTITVLQEFRVEDIPDNCVIKMNNGSSRNIIIKDGEIIGGFGRGGSLASQVKEVEETILEWQKPYNPAWEPHYKYVEPKLFLEKLMYPVPEDLKFFVFHGKVRIIQLDSSRFSSHCRLYYDRNWQDTGCGDKDHVPCDQEFPKPNNLEQLIEAAEKLAPPIDFVRVDLYNIEGRILAGELTFSPGAGSEDIQPAACDKMFSSWW